jgi:hypothetical protein
MPIVHSAAQPQGARRSRRGTSAQARTTAQAHTTAQARTTYGSAEGRAVRRPQAPLDGVAWRTRIEQDADVGRPSRNDVEADFVDGELRETRVAGRSVIVG